jgi:HlyD family secretion protein
VSQDPFDQLHKKRSRGWIFVVLLLAVAVAGGVVYARRRSAPTGPRYLTVAVGRGEIVASVETSGSLQPDVQVQVGSQVSGRMSRVLVDFNARVTRGQLLAEIDSTPFRAAVAQSRAAVLGAQAQLQRAQVNVRVGEINLARASDLRSRGLNAPADVDTARGSRDLALADVAAARAEIARARASLSSAETNLAFTRITTPIDGVVIQRSIDEGQTVAASFQAPTLFQIAGDLTRMRIIANVDEADIAQMREHLMATARVDAFPGETFRGELIELRYGSQTTSGVVTYPAVITVANPDLKLRPGMTATVTVVAARHPGVLFVPNAALRFRPASATADGGATTIEVDPRHGTLYVLRGGRPVAVPVTLGLHDDRRTEVSGAGLAEGAQVITDEIEQPAATGGPGAPGMGARRRPP